MRRRWLLGLLLIPLADVLLLLWIADRIIGAAATVALVVLTALIGMLLVRAEGRHTLRQLQARAERGEVPSDELLDTGLLIAAAAFLLTPGLVTDALGLVLVIPVTRTPVRFAIKRWFIVPMLERRTGGFVSGEVYTRGYPFGGGPSKSAGETVDLGPDAYRIDVEGDDDNRDDGPSNGNA